MAAVANAVFILSALLTPGCALVQNAALVQKDRATEGAAVVAEKSIAELAPVWKVVLKPHDRVTQIGGQVKDFTHFLETTKKNQHTELQAQKVTYEKDLQEHSQENHRVLRSNTLVKHDVEALKASSKILRATAKNLVEKNEELRVQLTRLMANMSTAHEFTETALSSHHDRTQNSTELIVLHELDKKDLIKSDEKTHENELSAVEGTELSLLEVSMEHHRAHMYMQSRHNATEFLSRLQETLVEMAQEQNASFVNLNGSYQLRLGELEVKHLALLDTSSTFNSSKANETVLNLRLDVAVKHLSKVHDKLLTQTKGLMTFLQKLGGRKALSNAAKIAIAKAGYGVRHEVQQTVKDANKVRAEVAPETVEKKVHKEAKETKAKPTKAKKPIKFKESKPVDLVSRVKAHTAHTQKAAEHSKNSKHHQAGHHKTKKVMSLTQTEGAASAQTEAQTEEQKLEAFEAEMLSQSSEENEAAPKADTAAPQDAAKPAGWMSWILR